MALRYSIYFYLFVYGLFNVVVSSQTVESSGRIIVNNDLERT
jgi:hypothetical protein